MSGIKISRPKQDPSVSPATVLPAALLLRPFRIRWNLTVVIDGHRAGKIGPEQEKIFDVEPGQHRVHMRFVLLRRSKQLRVFLGDNDERQLICGTNGVGWPTLREVSSHDVSGFSGHNASE